jgi:O-antigen/teichoic acid export membrane protein/thymidylate kinase
MTATVESFPASPARPAGDAAAAATPAPPRRVPRTAWALADQALISGTNFLTMVFAARGLHTHAFGTFTLAYSALLFANTFQSSLVTQPHNVLGSSRTGPAYARYTTATAISQLLISAAAACIVLCAAFVCRPLLPPAFPILLALVPTIVAWQSQEFLRRVLYTEGRTHAAFAIDLISYGGQLVLFAWLLQVDRMTAPLALVSIAGTSAIAALVGVVCIRHSLSARPDRQALRDNWTFGRWLAGAEILNWCSSVYMYEYVAAVTVGVAASGILKACQTVFGPTRILAYFLGTLLPIRFAHTLSSGGPAAMQAQFRRVYRVVVPLAGVYSLAVIAFAGPILRLLYGHEYAHYAGVLSLYAVAVFLWYSEMILSAAMTARQKTRYIFAGYVYGVLVALSLGWSLIRSFGPAGAVLGMILTTLAVTLQLYRAYRRETAAAEPRAAAPTVTASARTPGEILTRLFDVLHADRTVVYCILHGYRTYPDHVPSDVDLLVDRATMSRLPEILATHRDHLGADVVQSVADDALYIVLSAPTATPDPVLLRLHACTDYRLGGHLLYRGGQVLARRRSAGAFWIPAPDHEFAATLLRRADKGSLDPATSAHLSHLFNEDPAAAAEQLRHFLPAPKVDEVCALVARGDHAALQAALPTVRARVHAQPVRSSILSDLSHRLRRWARPPGFHVVFLGPDGVGKSTVLDAVRERLAPVFFGTTYRTYAPMVFRNASAPGKGPTPHSLPLRSLPASLAKAGYWFLYYTLGYYPTAYRDRARGCLAINHRYLLDALVDPRRYRYSGPRWLLRLIWKACPKPDLVILLDAPPDVILSRKQELAPQETARQCAAYRLLVGRLSYGRIVDASGSIADVVGAVQQTLLTALAERAERRAGRPAHTADDCTTAAPPFASAPPAPVDTSTTPGPLSTILPRSHTWLYLLPAATTFDCPGVPAWFLPPPRRPDLTARTPARALLLWRPGADTVVDASAYDTVVCVDPSPAARRRLQRLGFPHVRRFAVIPDLHEPRWFIPLDNPTLSSAAFCLYTPFKFSARAKLFGTRAAIRFGLPLWYRHSITIATRRPSPLDGLLDRLFPNADVHLALSSGSPGPDARSKPSLAILSGTGDPVAFLKIAGSPVAAALLRHEAEVLPVLARSSAPGDSYPRLLFAGDINGTYVLAQSPIPGTRVGPDLTPAHHRFLSSLIGGGPSKSALATSLVQTILHLAADHRVGDLALRDVLAEATPALAELHIPPTITHTDFVPWNLRLHDGTLGAFDWDTADADGLPLYDHAYHDVTVGYCLHQWSADRAAAHLLALANTHPYSLPADGARAILAVTLVHSLLRLLTQGHPQTHPMVRWYADILTAVQASARTAATGVTAPHPDSVQAPAPPRADLAPRTPTSAPLTVTSHPV